MIERGVTKEEVVSAIREGERLSAKKGRVAFRKNFSYNKNWGKKHYHIKQVMPIVIEEKEQIIVITAFSFYF